MFSDGSIVSKLLSFNPFTAKKAKKWQQGKPSYINYNYALQFKKLFAMIRQGRGFYELWSFQNTLIRQEPWRRCHHPAPYHATAREQFLHIVNFVWC